MSWIDHWEPEKPEFWESRGKRIARKNLVFSILAENLGFSVWVLMSIVVVSLGSVGFAFSVGQQFWLLIVPNLVGAALRVPYTFAVPRFGGRVWTTISAGLLLIPCAMLAYAVSTPGTPYWFFLLTSAAMGLGGGNFSSSMANISFFYPEGKKGLALGLNAAGGNLGVAVTQLVVPIVITIGTGIHLAYAALIWMPFIVVATACAWFFMDSLTQAKPDGQSYKLALSNPHTWVMSFLYIGTFGSFIGFSFAFPSLIKISFVDYKGWVALAFLGALIGSVARPLGGWLADRIGGAKVTLAHVRRARGGHGRRDPQRRHAELRAVLRFVHRAVRAGRSRQRLDLPDDPGDLPHPVRRRQVRQAPGRRRGRHRGCDRRGRWRAGEPRLQVLARRASKSLTPALTAFLVFYGLCVGTTWWFYLRRNVFAARPSLAYAGV